jgi:predicted amidohydrolase
VSQIRLYFDEDSGNMSLVEALRNEDIDVLTTPEANTMGYSDQDQLLWATQQNRIIYSNPK